MHCGVLNRILDQEEKNNTLVEKSGGISIKPVVYSTVARLLIWF